MPTMYQRNIKRLDQFEEIYSFSESLILKYAKRNDLKIIYTTPIGVIGMGSCGAFSRLRERSGSKRFSMEVYFSYEDLGDVIAWNKSEQNIKIT